MKKCAVEGCPKPYRCSGYCAMHYQRVTATGDPGPVGRILSPANQPCGVEGCPAMSKARGLCQNHANRARRERESATTDKRIHSWATLDERLRRVGWNEIVRVVKLGPCWEWAGGTDRNGYGRLAVGKQRMATASRAAFEAWRDDFDPALGVLHACDNPPCMNPGHLFQGDQFVNMGDCHVKGRTARGEKQGAHKLTTEQVEEIRARYAPWKVTQAALASEYGVSQTQISNVVRGKQWQHVG